MIYIHNKIKRKIALILTGLITAGCMLSVPLSASAKILPPATKDNYVPRTESPNINNPAEDPYYYDGNYNPFASVPDLQLPNCTTYAYGRAYEILGHEPNITTYGADYWYRHNIERGTYAYGQEPRVGAIACWQNHVGIVEYVAPDKSYIKVSESAYGQWERYFVMETYYRVDNTYPMWNRPLYGFIYLIDETTPTEPEKPEEQQEIPIEIPAGKTFAGWQDSDEYIANIDDDSYVNMRTEPNTYSTIINQIKNKETITITQTTVADGYTWGKTTYQGTTGWVALDFFDKQNETPIIKTQGDINGNGKFEINDITDLQRTLADINDYETNKYIADTDCNGDISISDATTLQQILAEFENLEDITQILYPQSKKLEYIQNGTIINTINV